MVFSGYLDFKYCDISSIDKCTARFKGNKLMPVSKLNQNSNITITIQNAQQIQLLYIHSINVVGIEIMQLFFKYHQRLGLPDIC